MRQPFCKFGVFVRSFGDGSFGDEFRGRTSFGSFGDVHETFARAPAVRSTLEFAGHYSIQHLPEIVCLFLACLSGNEGMRGQSTYFLCLRLGSRDSDAIPREVLT